MADLVSAAVDLPTALVAVGMAVLESAGTLGAAESGWELGVPDLEVTLGAALLW